MYLDYSNIKFDSFGRPEKPELMLKTLGDESLGIISGVSNVRLNIKFSEPSEISFDVSSKLYSEEGMVDNPIYEKLIGLRQICTDVFGNYVINNPEKESDGIEDTMHIVGYSLEKMWEKKIFFLEEGTYNFWNPVSPDDTVLYRMIELMPGWTIGDVSPTLIGKYRTFDKYDDYLLDFAYNTAPEKYRCVFVFDTYNKSVNVYSVDEEYPCAPIYLDFDNLIENVKVSELTDGIYTALSPYGADDLDVRDVNPIGSNWLYDLSWFINNGDIPEQLAAKWDLWQAEIINRSKEYTGLIAMYNSADSQAMAIRAEIVDLKGILTGYQNEQSVIIQQMALETTDAGKQYQEEQLYNVKRQIDKTNNSISEKEFMLEEIEANKVSYWNTVKNIVSELSYNNRFTQSEKEILSNYIIENTLNDETFVSSGFSTDMGSTSRVYSVDGGTISVSDSTIEEITMRSEYGKIMYTLSGGSFNYNGNAVIAGDIIRGTVEISSTANADGSKNFVMTAFLGSTKFGTDTLSDLASSAIVTLYGALSTSTTDVHDVPSEEFPDVVFRQGTSISIACADNTTMYISTSVSDYEKYSVQLELYEFAKNELHENASPSYEFSIDSGNFLFAKEFEEYKNALRLGRGVYLSLSEDEVITPYLIEVELNYDDQSNLGLVFSTKFKRDDQVNNLKDMIEKSYSSGRNFETSKYIYNQTVSQQSEVEKFMNNALDASAHSIVAAQDQSVVIDGAGIRINGEVNNKDIELRIINGMIAMSDDGWQTSKLAIGYFATDNGNYFGVNADTIAGKLLVGNNLVIENKTDTGIMQFKVDQSGAWLYNSTLLLQNENGGSLMLDPNYGFAAGNKNIYTTNGTTVTPIFIDENGRIIDEDGDGLPDDVNFYIDMDGDVYMNGTITSSKGSIGGWTIADKKLYSGSGETYVALNAAGGNDASADEHALFAIWAGANNPESAPFYVKRDGTVRIADGSFTGDINATSGTFTGTINATDGTFTGAISGSTISGTDISGGKITGTTIEGNTITGGTVSGSTISGGTVTGTTMSGGTISGSTINVNDNFIVDANGNVSLKGNITWGDNNKPTADVQMVYALYSRTNISKPVREYSFYPASSSTLWHNTFDSNNDYYTSYSYDGGKTWSDIIKIRGTDGSNGNDGTNGSDGKDGISYYTWIRYADDANGTNMSATPGTREYIGIAYNKTTASPSNKASDYTWSLFKGADGINGTNGDDGITYYTWIKYAYDANGTGITDNPDGKTYIGIAYNKAEQSESSNPSDYSWSLIKGADGEDGEDGITYYTWIKYADDNNGTNMSSTPGTREYIGIAYNKTSATASNNYRDYTWSLFKGSDGVNGTDGDDGITYYTWIKYADSPTSGMSDTPDGKKYIGIAYNKAVQAESTNYSDYNWSLIKGEDGEDGITYYTWIRYADDANGTNMSDTPSSHIYIGIATNKETSTPSNNPSDYKWSKIKGEQGEVGKGIASITEEYAISTSKTTAPTSGWSTTPPQWEFGKYIWTRSKIIYTNPSGTEYTTPLVDSSWEAVNEIEIGGRNLVLDSGNFSRWILSSKATASEDGSIVTISNSGLTSDKWDCATNILSGSFDEWESNTNEVVFSIEVKSDDWSAVTSASGTGLAGITLALSKLVSRTSSNRTKYMSWRFNNTSMFDSTTLTDGKWIKISSKPFVLNSSIMSYGTDGDASYYGIQLYLNRNGTVQFRRPQIEFGNKLTEWRPAPEDAIIYVDKLVSDLQEQVDGKIETFSQASDPSTSWTTDAIKTQHTGDLWYDTTNKVTKRWSGTAWVDIENAEAQSATALAQKKAQVFTSTPTVPYYKGDLWITATNKTGVVKTCVTSRTTGSYTASDWVEGLKYTDDTTVDNLQIGGRNLLRNTSLFSDSSADWAKSRATFNKGIVTLTPTASSAGAKRVVNYLDYSDYNDKTVTVSCDIRLLDIANVEQQQVSLSCGFNDKSRLANTFSSTYDYYKTTYVYATKEWKRFSGTVNLATDIHYGNPDAMAPGNYLTVQVYLAGGSAPVEFKNIKLEVGNKATDWSIAPEDGIISVDVEYKLSDSRTELTGNNTDWTTTVPYAGDNQYIWSRTKTVHGDGTISYIPSENGSCIASTPTTDEELFRMLTDNGNKVGIFTAEDGRMLINADYIQTGTLSSKTIKLNGNFDIYTGEDVGSILGGHIGYMTGSDGSGSATNGAVLSSPNNNNYFIATDSGVRLTYSTNGKSHSIYAHGDGARIAYSSTNYVYSGVDGPGMRLGNNYVELHDGAFIPVAGASPNKTIYLGSSSYRWESVWARTSSIQTSDRNEKKDISYDMDKYIDIFDNLRPANFKMIDGTSGRSHTGFIAQDIEDTLEELDIDSREFAMLVKDVTEDDEQVTYGLRYNELISVMTEKIHRQQHQIDELEARISALE